MQGCGKEPLKTLSYWWGLSCPLGDNVKTQRQPGSLGKDEKERAKICLFSVNIEGGTDLV